MSDLRDLLELIASMPGVARMWQQLAGWWAPASGHRVAPAPAAPHTAAIAAFSVALGRIAADALAGSGR